MCSPGGPLGSQSGRLGLRRRRAHWLHCLAALGCPVNETLTPNTLLDACGESGATGGPRNVVRKEARDFSLQGFRTSAEWPSRLFRDKARTRKGGGAEHRKLAPVR